MSDIVKRLCERATSYRAGGPSSEHTATMLEEAAAEIERLSEANTHVWAENERLRAAMKTVYGLPNFAKHYGTQLHDEIRSLKGAP